MKRIWIFTLLCCIGIMHADAAVRDAQSVSRGATPQSAKSTPTVIARATTTTAPVSRRSENAVQTSTSRGGRTTVARSATTTARDATTTLASSSPRSAVTINTSHSASTTATSRSATNRSVVRTATPRQTVATPARSAQTPRATTITSVATTNTFGTEYNQCRNAYFTCMDQFCATMDDSYRRCICSSRLTDIQDRERALGQTSDQLQDFTNLNLDVISKTAAEVNAMLTASEGELAITTDESESAQQLAGISDVLSSSKSQALSTLGTLDIAGDINQIWATTDLASGQNIANLTGEPLYNAVHTQCVDLVADSCPTKSTLDMVISAYGMYIENDCTTLLNALDGQHNQANSSIRQTEHAMNVARLENYNAHNSTAINDCIANVRADITADTACGTDYVHCLDITGRYLNRDTGEPIYTPNFYELGTQISLDGDVLTNSTNRLIVTELNNKRIYAQGSLDTCRDIADDVWDEFLRQAIVEIYQGQQAKIRDVKNECLDVVNQCYDEQNESLKDFSNIKEELLLGSRLELSEELCAERLYACSNLYGDPDTDGLDLLLSAMHEITDQKIAKECRTLLEAFAQDTCSTSVNDSAHSYPYGCRVYSPGSQTYASIAKCNRLSTNTSPSNVWYSEIVHQIPTEEGDGYICPDKKQYDSCNSGYYMVHYNESSNEYKMGEDAQQAGNYCLRCPAEYTCAGGVATPVRSASGTGDAECGDYAGSLYHKMVRYAMQVCVRPSESEAILSGTTPIPAEVLGDVNAVMDSVKQDMAQVLSAECEKMDGTWVDSWWLDEYINDSPTNITPDTLHDITGQSPLQKFYDDIGANTKWGFCADAAFDTLNALKDETKCSITTIGDSTFSGTCGSNVTVNVSGRAVCSETSPGGGNDNIGAITDQVSTSTGSYCWCQMTFPYKSAYFYAGNSCGSDGATASECPSTCQTALSSNSVWEWLQTINPQ